MGLIGNVIVSLQKLTRELESQELDEKIDATGSEYDEPQPIKFIDLLLILGFLDCISLSHWYLKQHTPTNAALLRSLTLLHLTYITRYADISGV